MTDFEALGHDDWDPAFAEDLIGCTLLVGLTFVDHADALIRRQQAFGTVESIDKSAGITIIQHENGERLKIAPVAQTRVERLVINAGMATIQSGIGAVIGMLLCVFITHLVIYRKMENTFGKPLSPDEFAKRHCSAKLGLG